MTIERIRPSYYRPRGRGNKIRQTYSAQRYVSDRKKYGIPGGIAWAIGEVRPANTYRGYIRNVYFNRSKETKLINYRAYRKALLNERRREEPKEKGWAIRI